MDTNDGLVTVVANKLATVIEAMKDSELLDINEAIVAITMLDFCLKNKDEFTSHLRNWITQHNSRSKD